MGMYSGFYFRKEGRKNFDKLKESSKKIDGTVRFKWGDKWIVSPKTFVRNNNVSYTGKNGYGFGFSNNPDKKERDIEIYFKIMGGEVQLADLIEAVRFFYSSLKIGGYGVSELEDEGFESHYLKKNPSGKSEDYNFLEFSRFWSATLLTPEEVKKYGGREKVLNAPCEIIEEFEDGAIFLLLDKHTIQSIYNERLKLRNYFGEGWPYYPDYNGKYYKKYKVLPEKPAWLEPPETNSVIYIDEGIYYLKGGKPGEKYLKQPIEKNREILEDPKSGEKYLRLSEEEFQKVEAEDDRILKEHEKKVAKHPPVVYHYPDWVEIDVKSGISEEEFKREVKENLERRKNKNER